MKSRFVAKQDNIIYDRVKFAKVNKFYRIYT